MGIDFDIDLSAEQWDTLKALRNPISRDRHLKGYVVDGLVGWGLIAIEDGLPLITPIGRRVLVRGSARLLDVALYFSGRNLVIRRSPFQSSSAA